MKILFVVFFLIDGQWIEGDPNKGWGPIPYATEEICLTTKVRSEALQAKLKMTNPRARDKRFECVAL